MACALVAALGARPLHGGSFPDPDYLIDVWETEQGLPENSATAMVQTPDGYLWFGTFNGLVRFDGVRFTVFDRSNTPELPSPGIVNLHLDRQGRLWVSTMLGMAVVRDGRWTTLGESSGWVGNYARFFAESPSGDLYLTTFDAKLLRFRGDRFEEMALPPTSAPRMGLVPLVDEQGALWIVNPRFIGKRVGEAWQSVIPVDPLLAVDPKARISAAAARDGGLWIATRGHLRKYREGRLVSERRAPWPMEGFWSMHEDSAGNVWICSHSHGVYQVTPQGRWRHFTTGQGLSYHAARFVFEDREGNRWVGTSGGGLLRFKPRQFSNWGPEQGMPERIIESLSADRKGRLVLGTHGQGVVWLQGSTVERVHPRGGLLGVTPMALSTLVDRRDRLWVGSLGEGLHLVEEGRVRSFFVGGQPGATGASVYSLFEDSHGAVWIGLDDGDPLSHEGATRFADGRFHTYPLQGSPRHNRVHCFAESPGGGPLWAGTQAGGLYRLDGERFVPVPEAAALVNDRISSLLADGDGTLWIGTEDGGIVRLRQGRLARISEAQGLPARSIASILDDGLGHLWLGSNRGILRVPRLELEAVLAGRPGPIAGQAFDLSDGLATVECTIGYQPNALRAQDGRLWFATLKGAVSVDPRALRLNTVPPPVVIEQVLVDGQPLRDLPRFTTSAAAPQAPVIVPPGAKRLEIHYAGLSFTAPEKIRFRLKLEGLDNEWVEVGTRRVAYLQDLTPGRYRLRVEAANNDGVWNRGGAALGLAVRPLLWQTLWFRLLALAALVGSVVLASVRATRRKLQRRIAALEQQRALEEAEEKYRKIFDNAVEGIFQLTPEGRFLAANPALARLLGYGSAAELLADPIPAEGPSWAEPGRMPIFRRALEEADARQGSVQGFLARLRRRDGAPIWLSVNAHLVRDGGGAVAYYEGTAEDITERKRVEAVERQLQDSLRRAETLSAMGSLVAGVAHEVRNPLFAISANLDAFEATEEVPGGFTPLLNVMRTEVNRLTSLMQGLLDYGKPMPPARSPGAMDAVVAEAVESCAGLAASRQARLVNGVAPGLPQVLMDRKRLVQVFQNILQNALQHAPEGSLVLVDAAEEVRKDGRELVLTVSDSGPGFTAEDLPHLFEPFFTRRRGGTGLGLAIVQRIVEEHGGTVTAASRPEGGAIVTVRLGSVDAASSRALRAPPAGGRPG